LFEERSSNPYPDLKELENLSIFTNNHHKKSKKGKRRRKNGGIYDSKSQTNKDSSSPAFSDPINN